MNEHLHEIEDFAYCADKYICAFVRNNYIYVQVVDGKTQFVLTKHPDVVYDYKLNIEQWVKSINRRGMVIVAVEDAIKAFTKYSSSELRKLLMKKNEI